MKFTPRPDLCDCQFCNPAKAVPAGRYVETSELTAQISPAANPSIADRAMRMIIAAMALSGTDKVEAFKLVTGWEVKS